MVVVAYLTVGSVTGTYITIFLYQFYEKLFLRWVLFSVPCAFTFFPPSLSSSVNS